MGRRNERKVLIFLAVRKRVNYLGAHLKQKKKKWASLNEENVKHITQERESK